jgi:methionine synthase II (cobalamin-independent)
MEGIVPSQLRFQVALPTAAAFLNAHLVYEHHAIVEPVYRERLFSEVEEILSAIPHRDLAIQWDVSTEMGQWEGVRHAHFPDVKAGVVERLALHCQRVPRDVELGVHLCYGSYGGRHWKEPESTANMVEVHNRLAAKLERPIDYVHMPVPLDRADDAYFKPLAGLRLDSKTKLFLGLVHDTDGVEGTRKRIDAAAKYAGDFGIATECGFGRRPPETIPNLLRVHAEL